MEEILLLTKGQASILLIEERKNSKVLIGAPHHAPGGEQNMPCPEHPDADENTGLIARKLAMRIDASSVIACNYRIDPNKNLRTDYALQIAQWEPDFLIEIHGHGAKNKDNPRKPGNHTIEVSCGIPERNEQSKTFADILRKRISEDKDIGHYEVVGDMTKIYFTAKNTATVTDNRWIAFHIEFPPSLRITENKKLPDIAENLIIHLAATITEVCK